MYSLKIGDAVVNYDLSNDSCMDAPWNEYDGHGVITNARRAKRPYEVILSADSGYCWFYDVTASLVTAKRDNWGSTPKARAKAVELDIKFCKSYLRGDIAWYGVRVWLENNPNESTSLGGILSEYNDKHVEECVRELGRELLDEVARREAAALAYYLGM